MSKRKFDVKLRKVGNSYVVTIPKDTIDRFNLEEGDFVAIDLDTDDVKKPVKFLDHPKNLKKENKDLFGIKKTEIKKQKNQKQKVKIKNIRLLSYIF